MTASLELSGKGTLAATPVLVDMQKIRDPKIGDALVTAQKARLVRYTDVVANHADPATQHAQTLDPDGEVMGEFADLRFQFETVSGSSILKIRCHGFLEAAFEFEGGVKLLPADADRAGRTNRPLNDELPREEFEDFPNGLTTVRQVDPNGDFTGSFNLLIEAASFRIESSGSSTTYRTERTEQKVQGASVWSETWYKLYVEEGTYHAAALSGSMLLRTESVHVAHSGPLAIAKASGTLEHGDHVQSIQGQDIALDGELDAKASSVKKSDGEYALRFDFEEETTPSTPPLSGGSLPIPAGAGNWLPFGGLLAAFFVLGIATYGWRHVHIPKPGASPRAAPMKPSQRALVPGAEPHHSVVDHVENTYRADPGNVAAALELGLTYGRAGRHQEALPLLLLSIQSFPKVESLRYQAALALLSVGRAEDAVRHLEYAFRLNPLNIARFLKEGPAHEHGRKPPVSALLHRWSRHFHETSHRGYA